jgi:hypothetical protein
MEQLEHLRYPIGRFEVPQEVDPRSLEDAVNILEIFPVQLKELVGNLETQKLDMPYRPGGWTIRQLVHHIADSHHHSYIRFKWALTEDNPVIKAYDEKAWAGLGDYEVMPIDWSLRHLEVVHRKLVYLLRRLDDDQWKVGFRHPESGEETDLRVNALRYAWHSMHHYTHIKNALERA